MVIYKNIIYAWEDVKISLKKVGTDNYHYLKVKGNPKISNKRKYTRLDINNACEIKNLDDNYVIRGEMKNICANGFCFTTKDNSFNGKEGKIIKLYIEDFEVLNGEGLQGEILRVTQCDGYYVIGGQMLKDYAEIDDYINSK